MRIQRGALRSTLIQHKLDPRFLNYYLLSDAGQRQIDSFQAGGNRQGLNFRQIRSFRLPLPPVPEQRAIAAALSDADALLAKLDQIIAKKRDLKRAAVQQLLTGQTRLPGFGGEWEEIRLGELFDYKNGLNKAKTYFGKGTPIVNYLDVFSRSAIRFSSLAGRVSLTRQEIENFNVRKGDVFFQEHRRRRRRSELLR
jgi:type I restriction enzyme S subunit